MSSTPSPSIERMRVKPHDDGWALFVDKVPMPAWVVSTRDRALRAGRRAAKVHDARLRVFDQAGKITEELDFTS